MSQKKEKYARSMEKRVGKLEDRVDKMDTELTAHAIRLYNIEDDLAVYNAAMSAREEKRIRAELAAKREARNEKREQERIHAKRVTLAVLFGLLAILVMIIMARAADANRAEDLAPTPTASVTVSAVPDQALYILASTPVSTERVDPLEGVPVWEWPEDVLLAHGYYSLAVPMPYEYQGYMRRYCEEYGCPYPLALAVADWETRGRFNMDAVGADGEVGIMQLLPGPDGAYHDELEAATSLDPTTPEGNIAGGCYLLGKYLAEFGGDVEKTAMAYNMGRSGAKNAWAAGVASTEYSRAVAQAVERWECTVNAWNGV